MKKIIVILSFITISFSAFATASNDSVSDKVFKKLKSNHTESFSMSFSKNMIDFFDMDLDFNGKEKLITGDFHKGNMMVFKEVKSTTDFLEVFNAEKYELIESDEKEIDLKDDDNSEAFLYVNRKGSKVTEAHFVIVNDESVTVLSVFGDIKVKNK